MCYKADLAENEGEPGGERHWPFSVLAGFSELLLTDANLRRVASDEGAEHGGSAPTVLVR